VKKLKMVVKSIQIIEKKNKIEFVESIKRCMDASLDFEHRVMKKMQENVSRC